MLHGWGCLIYGQWFLVLFSATSTQATQLFGANCTWCVKADFAVNDIGSLGDGNL